MENWHKQKARTYSQNSELEIVYVTLYCTHYFIRN